MNIFTKEQINLFKKNTSESEAKRDHRHNSNYLYTLKNFEEKNDLNDYIISFYEKMNDLIEQAYSI